MLVQWKKLSNGGPKYDGLVRQEQKYASEVLGDQINDGGKDGHTTARERTSLGTLYNDMSWEEV
jgi:hypothetical protein